MTGPLGDLDQALTDAREAWETLADVLGKQYNDAYKLHSDALGKMREARKAEIETQYFILGLVCVAVSGGIAGGLMAPFIKEAGKGIADATVRKLAIMAANAASTMARQGVQGGTQAILRGIQPDVGSGPYTPSVDDPFGFYLGMKTQLGICFMKIKEDLRALASSKTWDHRLDSWLLDAFQKSCVLISDMPESSYVAHINLTHKVQAAMELAMWVAWANVRDMDYWNKAYGVIESGGSPDASSKGGPPDDSKKYVIDAERLDPVMDRMVELLVSNKVSLLLNGGRRILDIRKLQKLDLSILDIFKAMPKVSFGGLSGGSGLASMTPQSFEQFRPLYKR